MLKGKISKKRITEVIEKDFELKIDMEVRYSRIRNTCKESLMTLTN